ncbi:L,D-transpeptidase family protein [Nakamurella panacisegetis]|uniref:L,D-transpeptidase family protein n=1 Tax=Nakamurella panacisegetis TaxID=1090615 RepID=UPI000B88580E|nr:L,D-transpeptidase family protein [Nakamurella panacisegetis]
MGNATQIITVSASSRYSTTATLIAWQKQTNGSWARKFGPVTAHLGQDGVGAPSEYSSRTPAGTWTLTQAFGRSSNPGTGLSYFRTDPLDWWDENPDSPTYNRHVRSSSSPGGSSEHLYYEVPYYNYAVVMNVNTAGVPGGGSAFFLHVTDGGPTAGCVSIDQGTLVKIMQWLKPGGHPRIAIGVS